MAYTRNTVDRLDKPSSYTANKVKHGKRRASAATLTDEQNRKRKRHGRDEDQEMQDGADGAREEQPDFVDKLATATTLYVGNLQVPYSSMDDSSITNTDIDPSIQPKNKSTSFSPKSAR